MEENMLVRKKRMSASTKKVHVDREQGKTSVDIYMKL
jgi:hypothetical protein